MHLRTGEWLELSRGGGSITVICSYIESRLTNNELSQQKYNKLKQRRKKFRNNNISRFHQYQYE